MFKFGDIGFYTDFFSVLLVLFVGCFALMNLRCNLSSTRHDLGSLDVIFVIFVSLCLVSFSSHAYGVADCQNLALLLAGCLSFVAFCGRCTSNHTGRILISLAGFVLLLCGFVCIKGDSVSSSLFSNTNYLAGFVAVVSPIMVGAARDCGKERMKSAIGYGVVSGLSVALIVLICGRTALMGVVAALTVMLMPVLILWWRTISESISRIKALRWLLVVVALTGACAVAVPVARQLYMLKPISGAGRLLIWSVAVRMAAQSPLAGVGFSNLANTYNLFQANYFAHGGGSVPQRMAADPCRHAFNEPLEVATEVGLPGFLVFAVFCGLILKEVWEVVRRNGAALRCASVDGASVRRCSVFGIQYSVKEEQRQKIPQPCRRWRHGADAARDNSGSIRGAEVAPTLGRDWLTLGMAGSVVCFMIMSLFHFPRKVVPTWLVFNYALAWIVTANQKCKQGVDELKTSQKNMVVSTLCWRVFWFVAFVGSVALLPLYVKNYLDARRWIAAHELMVTGEFARASAAYTELYHKLKWSGRFCAYYGNAVMAASENTNQYVGIDENPAERAVSLYEKAKYTYPDPYMFENLAVAYLRLADGTNWPVVAQTKYRMETPAQALKRKLREWRCGTNLFFEPPATQLTRGDCIRRAIDYLTLASNILSWRLTSKWYLAQVYRNVGDVSNAMKYAQVVVNIPMKKDTPQGREFKRKAQRMLNDLGVPCDDPGMVVFDIHDRKTWNEGKW